MSAIFRIIKFTKQFWRWYIVAGFFVLITSALNIVAPILGKMIVDQIMAQITGKGANVNLVIILLGLVLATQIIQILLQALGGWIGDIIQVRLQTYLSTVFYQHLLKLHVGFYDEEVTGKTMNKMYRGLEQITGFVQNMINNFLPFLVTAVLTIAVLAYYSWIIALLLAALFPAYIWISHGSTMAWKKYQDQQNELSDKSLSRAYESIAGIRVVKAFATEAMELAHFALFRKDIEKLAIQQTKEWHIYDFARQFVMNGILFAIYAFVFYFTLHGRYTIGEMTLLLQLVQQARFPLFAMSFILGQIQRAEAGSKDFFGVLDTTLEVTDQPHAKAIKLPENPRGAFIEFEKVTFGYGDSPVLKNIDLSIHAGNKVALVGESGQGKSTLVNLLLRFYQPQQGKIEVAHQDINQVTQASLRRQMAVVFQDPLLFSGSIADNIRYAKPKATQEEIEKVAMAANAHEFITNLPDGYQSVVGERGVKLSGGQKQRIAIARAMLVDAPIVILDEATSALDSRSELAVQEGLERLMHGRTALIIAHRLSTVASADQIVVLANGTIAESGAPGHLLKNPNGQYSQLVALQQQLLASPTKARKQRLKQFDLVG